MLLRRTGGVGGGGGQLDAISQGPKSLESNPLPLALVMDLHASKHYARGSVNHRCINS
jgi:hypothetical protein